jgi:hypothetical protein
MAQHVFISATFLTLQVSFVGFSWIQQKFNSNGINIHVRLEHKQSFWFLRNKIIFQKKGNEIY